MIYRYKPHFFEAFRKALARPEPFPQLSAWTRKTRALVWAVVKAADEQGIDMAARKQLRLHLDKRDVSVETMLGTILHHAETEYPYLLGERGRFNPLVIHASNMNDRYFVIQLLSEESLQAAPLKAALEALRAHLDAIPNEQ
jgi:hypothetical protein